MNVGLTGNIGSGKSTVASLLAELGAAVVDADVLARAATDDPGVLSALAAAFGKAILQADGRLDRAALAAIVFSDKQALQTLNGIVHPHVKNERDRLLSELKAAGSEVIVHDIPLLYENGLEAEMDRVVVVDAPLETRLRRVMLRSGIDREEALRRDANQMPLEQKTARADHVIDNSGGLEQLRPQVEELWRSLLTSRSGCCRSS